MSEQGGELGFGCLGGGSLPRATDYLVNYLGQRLVQQGQTDPEELVAVGAPIEGGRKVESVRLYQRILAAAAVRIT